MRNPARLLGNVPNHLACLLAPTAEHYLPLLYVLGAQDSPAGTARLNIALVAAPSPAAEPSTDRRVQLIVVASDGAPVLPGSAEAGASAAAPGAGADKANFCLENDTIAAALLAYLRSAGTFTGTAAELAPRLVETDGDLRDKLSAKRLGKRLAALWPHLAKALAVARKEADRTGLLHFTFRARADCADFQTVFS